MGKLFSAFMLVTTLLFSWSVPAHSNTETTEQFQQYFESNDWPSIIEMGESAVDPLLDKIDLYQWEHFEKVTELLTKIGTPAVDPLLRYYSRKNKGFPDTISIANILVGIGSTAIPAIQPHLKTDTLPTKRQVALALHQLKWNPRTSEEKIHLAIGLQQWDQLENMGDEAIDIVSHHFHRAWIDKQFVDGLAQVLAKSQDPRVIPTLEKALKSHDHRKARAAAKALGDLGHPLAVEPLIRSVRSAYPEVVIASAKSLGKIGDTRAIPALRKNLQHKDQTIREHSAQALKILDYQPTSSNTEIELAIASKDWKRVAAFGEPAIDPLVEKLHDKDTHIRFGAQGALIDIGPKSVPAVLAWLNVTNPFSLHYVNVIGKVGNASHIELILPFLKQWQAGPSAAKALKQLGWKPKTFNEKMYYAIAQRNRTYIEDNWDIIFIELKRDLRSPEWHIQNNAINTMIGRGNTDTVDFLIELLDKHGNASIAKSLLNSGHEQLSVVGGKYLSGKGYVIMPSSEPVPVSWGKF